MLAAAERLLATERADFSMRDLAAEARVSFATPFNRFGGKAAILRALSAERIAAMQARFEALTLDGDAPTRVMAAVRAAATVMLESPAVNRAIMAGLGSPAEGIGRVWASSQALWAQALGDGRGFAPGGRALALEVLPGQLALSFRGALSFWTAGEIADEQLAGQAEMAAAALLLGFVANEGRGPLRHQLIGALAR